jgi:hypothetical protein
MNFFDYLFPVRIKDLEAIRVSYEKAMDTNTASLSVSFLWKKHNEPEVQRSFTKSKIKEGEDNR